MCLALAKVCFILPACIAVLQAIVPASTVLSLSVMTTTCLACELIEQEH